MNTYCEAEGGSTPHRVARECVVAVCFSQGKKSVELFSLGAVDCTLLSSETRKNIAGMDEASPLRYSPRAYGASALAGPRSVFGDSYASARSAGSGVSAKSSNARLFAQRDKSMSDDMHDSVREMSWNSSLHIVSRQAPWNSAGTGIQVPWHTQTSCACQHLSKPPHPPPSSSPTRFVLAFRISSADDRLNWDLEQHPPWIAKAPGTHASTFARNLMYSGVPPIDLHSQSRSRPFTADWDSRFPVANTLSGDPVINGHRKGLVNRRGTCVGNLSPSRPWLAR